MLSGQQQQAADEMEQQLLAQVMAQIMDRLHAPALHAAGNRPDQGDLQHRLHQARMHGIGFLINNASKKLRDARSLMDAEPCSDKLLDALLDTLVGIHFLGLLGRAGHSDPMAPPHPARTTADAAVWAHQPYYRFMDEVVTRAAAPSPDAHDVFDQGAPDARPPREALQSQPRPPQPATEAAYPSPAPATEPPMRPHNRMARLRQTAGQQAGRPPEPVRPAPPSSPPAATSAATPGIHAAGATGLGSYPASPPSFEPDQADYRRDAESQAWEDYTEQAGQVIYAGHVLTETGEVALPRPMLFTVLAGATTEAICHWQGNRLRPIWYVRPVGSQPASLKQQARVWIYGHEYDDAGRFYASSYFTPGLQKPAARPVATAPAAAPVAPAAASNSAQTTRRALETQAIEAYEAQLGRIMEVQELCGHVQALGDEVIHCVPPARVRVVRTSPDILLQWRNNELWSQWQVETVVHHSDLAQASRLRVAGPAWRASGERIAVNPVQQPL